MLQRQGIMMVALKIIQISFLLTNLIVAHGCEFGWEPYGQSCYLYNQTPETFLIAFTNCQALEAELLVLQDINEENFITGITSGDDIWLGAIGGWINDNSEVLPVIPSIRRSFEGNHPQYLPNSCLSFVRSSDEMELQDSPYNSDKAFICEAPAPCTTDQPITGPGNVCFSITDVNRNQQSAQNTCAGNGATLVDLDSLEEFSFIRAYLFNNTTIDYVWTGRCYAVLTFVQASTAELLPYSHWALNNPDDSLECVRLTSGEWYSYDCRTNSPLNYVCKKNTTEIISTTDMQSTVTTAGNIPSTLQSDTTIAETTQYTSTAPIPSTWFTTTAATSSVLTTGAITTSAMQSTSAATSQFTTTAPATTKSDAMTTATSQPTTTNPEIYYSTIISVLTTTYLTTRSATSPPTVTSHASTAAVSTQPSTAAVTTQPTTAAITTQPSTAAVTTQPTTAAVSTQPATAAATTQPSTAIVTTRPATTPVTSHPTTNVNSQTTVLSSPTTQAYSYAATTEFANLETTHSTSTTSAITTSTAAIAATSSFSNSTRSPIIQFTGETVITCGQPPEVTHATVNTDGVTYGSVALYRCLPRYRFPGGGDIRSIVCRSNGYWSAIVDKCEAVNCGVPASLDDAIMTSHSVMVGSVTAYECQTDESRFPDGHNRAWIVCDIHQVWTPMKTACEKRCGSLPYLENSLPESYLTDASGGPVVVNCLPNHRLSDGRITQDIWCLGNYHWTSGLNCKVDTCQKLPEVNHLVYNTSTVDCGTTVLAECEEGFHFDDHNTTKYIHCQSDKTWSINITECIISECPPAPVIVNGTQSGTNHYYNSSITYTCDQGYRLEDGHNQTTIVCGYKQWTNMAISCAEGRCPPVPAIVHAIPRSTSAVTGSLVRYDCHAGYHFQNETSFDVICQNEVWNVTDLECIPMTCKPYPRVLYANTLPLGTATVGDTVTIICHRGYELDGNRTVQSECTTSGSWSISRDACSPVDCGLPPPTNNPFYYNFTTSNYGSNVTAQCMPGYWFLRGQFMKTLICGSTATWQPEGIYCKPMECLPLPAWKGVIGNTTNCFTSTVVSVTCVNGSSFTDNSTEKLIECGPDGLWLPEIPECSEGQTEKAVIDTTDAEQASMIGVIVWTIVGVPLILIVLSDIPTLSHRIKMNRVCFKRKREAIKGIVIRSLISKIHSSGFGYNNRRVHTEGHTHSSIINIAEREQDFKQVSGSQPSLNQPENTTNTPDISSVTICGGEAKSNALNEHQRLEIEIHSSEGLEESEFGSSRPNVNKDAHTTNIGVSQSGVQIGSEIISNQVNDTPIPRNNTEQPNASNPLDSVPMKQPSANISLSDIEQKLQSDPPDTVEQSGNDISQHKGVPETERADIATVDHSSEKLHSVTNSSAVEKKQLKQDATNKTDSCPTAKSASVNNGSLDRGQKLQTPPVQNVMEKLKNNQQKSGGIKTPGVFPPSTNKQSATDMSQPGLEHKSDSVSDVVTHQHTTEQIITKNSLNSSLPKETPSHTCLPDLLTSVSIMNEKPKTACEPNAEQSAEANCTDPLEHTKIVVPSITGQKANTACLLQNSTTSLQPITQTPDSSDIPDSGQKLSEVSDTNTNKQNRNPSNLPNVKQLLNMTGQLVVDETPNIKLLEDGPLSEVKIAMPNNHFTDEIQESNMTSPELALGKPKRKCSSSNGKGSTPNSWLPDVANSIGTDVASTTGNKDVNDVQQCTVVDITSPISTSNDDVRRNSLPPNLTENRNSIHKPDLGKTSNNTCIINLEQTLETIELDNKEQPPLGDSLPIKELNYNSPCFLNVQETLGLSGKGQRLNGSWISSSDELGSKPESPLLPGSPDRSYVTKVDEITSIDVPPATI